MRDFLSKNGLVQLAKLISGSAAMLGGLGFTAAVAPLVGGQVVAPYLILLFMSGALFLLGLEGRVNNMLDALNERDNGHHRRRKHHARK